MSRERRRGGGPAQGTAVPAKLHAAGRTSAGQPRMPRWMINREHPALSIPP